MALQSRRRRFLFRVDCEVRANLPSSLPPLQDCGYDKNHPFRRCEEIRGRRNFAVAHAACCPYWSASQSGSSPLQIHNHLRQCCGRFCTGNIQPSTFFNVAKPGMLSFGKLAR